MKPYSVFTRLVQAYPSAPWDWEVISGSYLLTESFVRDNLGRISWSHLKPLKAFSESFGKEFSALIPWDSWDSLLDTNHLLLRSYPESWGRNPSVLPNSGLPSFCFDNPKYWNPVRLSSYLKSPEVLKLVRWDDFYYNPRFGFEDIKASGPSDEILYNRYFITRRFLSYEAITSHPLFDPSLLEGWVGNHQEVFYFIPEYGWMTPRQYEVWEVMLEVLPPDMAGEVVSRVKD